MRGNGIVLFESGIQVHSDGFPKGWFLDASFLVPSTTFQFHSVRHFFYFYLSQVTGTWDASTMQLELSASSVRALCAFGFAVFATL